ncbi:small-conductance mechanosensitive channel [Filimonas zeae]|uniref:Mechanosensitive ion channel n=1 Tax=Filimonas zeae TaxID=1737353 RepID=A0A917IWD5_9BACT|nr:mechanosensitive ion channel domain-containing protein [Filimonas zeae]MDR6339072.1 small-conductance mechanosensitive channel [Filimonas zeae]GGH65226.1 hypothetical protein GCM10011379_18150 [Filimonas zeae]
MKAIPRLFLLCVLLVAGCLATVQAQDTSHHAADSVYITPEGDTVSSAFVKRLLRFAAVSRKRSVADRQRDKAVMLQDDLFENLKKTMQRTRTYLHSGIDTAGISADLTHVERWYTIAGDGIFVNGGVVQTYRNLASSYNMLLVLQNRVQQHKQELDNYQRRLSQFRYQLDSLSSDPVLFAFPTDSAVLSKYVQKLMMVAVEVNPVDSTIEKAMSNVQALQAKVNMQVYRIESAKDEIEVYQRTLYRTNFEKEVTALWEPPAVDRPLQEIIAVSWKKGWLTLRFYTENNAGLVALLLLLVLLSAIYIRSLKKIYRQKNLLRNDFAGQLLLRYPVLSALIIVLNIFQFLFPQPPFVFSALLWVVSAISLTLVFRGFITRYWMRVWVIMLLLFLLACGNNTILQASGPERWFMAALSLAGLVTGIAVWVKKQHRSELREGWIVYFIGFLALLEVLALVGNCFGRYNMSKSLLTGGYFNVIIAIMFLWTVRLINEGLSLAFEVYSGQDRKLFYLNPQRVGAKAPGWFYVFMIVGWFILFGRNFYAFRLASRPVKDFLSQEHQVGDYSFTINTLFLFIGIMGVSVIVSRIVSWFASDKHLAGTGTGGREDKPGLGSWLLLIRIAIISLGLFLAFAAAGIPMDKIAIILGALGVGIGFGLQTLVNNLVSGLIIAFEKPVNVGDAVEIDNQAGTMKSIGFRSSVIATGDGADLVMPNGDLLNSHLINRTLGGNKRQLTLVVGVAYDTDLRKAEQLLKEVLEADDRILRYPAPLVLFSEFNTSAIDAKLLFWVKHSNDPFLVKSELIVAVHQSFQLNHISIPFPQSDVHIAPRPPAPGAA